MRCVICDDNKNTVRELISFTKDHFESNEYYNDLDSFSNALLHGKQFDVVFMDIDWGHNPRGLKTASLLTVSLVVYVTAYASEYVERIFTEGGHPFACLQKPVDRASFDAVMNKVERESEKKHSGYTITSNGRHVLLRWSEILYAEGCLHRTVFYLSNGKHYTAPKSLEHLAISFPEQFVRCHKSFSVNLQHVREFSRTKLILRNGKQLPVSRSHSAEARIRFMTHLSNSVLEE